jgi:Cdc6-like AAA superfamily ATPase
VALEVDAVPNWGHEDGKTLFCTGIPGAGKTILSSTVIENIKTHIATNSPKEVRVVYLYCDYTDKKQSISQFLFTLLGQILEPLPSLSEIIKAIYRDNRPVLPSIYDLSNALTHVTSSLTSDSHSCIFFVIDVLDECTDRTRALLLIHLIRIQETSNVSLFLTTRLHIGFEKFKDAMTLEIAVHDADIERYVDKCLFELCKDVQEDATLQKEVKSAIKEATGGMLVNMLWFC